MACPIGRWKGLKLVFHILALTSFDPLFHMEMVVLGCGKYKSSHTGQIDEDQLPLGTRQVPCLSEGG